MSALQKWGLSFTVVGIGMIIVGIWTNDWRWMATGIIVALPAGCVTIAAGL